MSVEIFISMIQMTIKTIVSELLYLSLPRSCAPALPHKWTIRAPVSCLNSNPNISKHEL